MDRIDPIRPRPVPEPIPAIRRPEGSTDRRGREGGQQDSEPKERREPRDPPPDDGLPHIDVTV